MERAREAPERLREQRVYRRRLLLDALANAEAARLRAVARGSARMVAQYDGTIRRAEEALAALDRTIAAAEA